MTVAALIHPSGSRQMALQSRTRPLRLTSRVDMKHQAGNVLPICSICVSLEEAQIRHEMLLIVACQGLNGWSQIGTSRIERRTPHGPCPCSKTPPQQGSHRRMATSLSKNEALVILSVRKSRLRRRPFHQIRPRVAADDAAYGPQNREISLVTACGEGRCTGSPFCWLLQC
jgi:hypothetical protein